VFGFFTDVVRAYFHAKARRDVHVDSPKEDRWSRLDSHRDHVVRARSTTRRNILGLWCAEMIVQYLDQELI
jgi:hypothetical protein